MRVIEKRKARGSLKWIRHAVNIDTQLFNEKVRNACGLTSDQGITWMSPLAEDDYAEYRDQAFLDRLGIKLERHPLPNFWPNRGPQWDALGKTDDGKVLLVEAKANVPEVVSPGTNASSRSRILIERSLSEVQTFLGINPGISWTGRLYQYANRIAHLYLLRTLNQIDTHLLFVYFTGDRDVGGPASVAEWTAALTIAKGVLGLGERHRLSRFVHEIFVDVAELSCAV